MTTNRRTFYKTIILFFLMAICLLWFSIAKRDEVGAGPDRASVAWQGRMVEKNLN